MLNGQKSLSGSSTRSPYRPFLEWGFAIGVATLRLAGIYPLPIKECGNRSAILNVIGVVWSVMVAACTGLATVFYFTLEGSPESIPDVVTYIYFSCCIAITRFGNVYLMLCSRAIALRLIHVHYLARPYATESDERVILFVMFFAFFFLVLRVGVDVIVYKSWLMDGYVSIQSMYGNGGFALTVTPMIIIILDQINYYVTFLLPVFYSVCMVYLGRVFRELGTVLRQFVNLAEGSVTFLQCQLKGHLELAEAVKRLHHILSPYLFLVFALHLTEIFSFVGRIAGKSFFWGTLLLDFCCAACVLAVLISALLYADSQVRFLLENTYDYLILKVRATAVLRGLTGCTSGDNRKPSEGEVL